MKELVDLEEKLLAYRGKELPDDLLKEAKLDGFADKYLAKILEIPEEKIRAQMFHLNGRAAPNAPAAPAASPAEPAGFAAPERPMPQGVSITADDFNDED